MSGIDHIAGHTWHGRKGAVENAFRYSVDYILLEPEAHPRLPRLMSRNRANLTALHDSDHGGAPGKGRGAAWVREVLETHDLPKPARIELLTQPRMLGHVFNPVSFWLCRDASDDLRVVVAEVSNTFGDRHSYLVHRDDLEPITATDRLRATKIFHVSPFQPLDGCYEFRFDIRDDRIGIWIDFTGGNGGVIATLCGTRKPASSAGLLRAALRRPFGSRRVLALIHWQALKLWWKGAGYRARPEPPAEEVSR
ncbi:DUF1365 domain-containing protein [Lutimaribacter sp. EGI FJ00015]|uniref:DUF1365 domain-containing protein n=1 Tax=Lutimaribacter degradans TaxID=2945989 RepID=A0ACC5ZX69_9RHOB|nr:DUF1365 domain-containing protein [Lutimaribacter sp. EGI FJ00013]MCM2562928.1 DUF1365 domain-containing protein [Lutimaribacter sp. EGI FJ00013]MCO0614096.1 DUF1365 domain-containing protein [Lutimaribacter sp. EGI FJ00015]MCO0636073.1 DUF1365 domain-containing protein [Lutimaribacter sp. EGI FJ00014]